MTDFGAPALISLLPPGELELLRASAIRRTYRDGDLIHDRGDDNPGMGVVVRGRVKLVNPLRDGRETFISFVNPGQNYGDTSLLAINRRSHRAIALGETEIDHVPKAAFLRLCERPDFVRALYVVASARLTVAVDVLDDMRSLAPDARLAKLLLMMVAATGEGPALDFLQEDYANLLGVSSVTLAKALRSLKLAGLIETGYRQIVIRDEAALRAWLAVRAPD